MNLDDKIGTGLQMNRDDMDMIWDQLTIWAEMERSCHENIRDQMSRKGTEIKWPDKDTSWNQVKWTDKDTSGKQVKRTDTIWIRYDLIVKDNSRQDVEKDLRWIENVLNR